MLKSVAIYDTLFVADSLEKKLEDVSEYEIQLFSYLACLLALYEGVPLIDWGYNFIKNEYGSPYSKEIKDAFDALLQKGSFEPENEFIKLSATAKRELMLYNGFSSNQTRMKYLNASCQSIRLLSYGVVKSSINQEPIIKYANQHSNKRLLTDEVNPAFSVLYDQFEMLKTALKGKSENIILPAVVWLEYLSKKNSAEEDAN